MTDNKMFNCTSCGPIEVAVVQGDWVGPEYANVAFDITRPSFTEFTATVSESSRHNIDRTRIPKTLAEVENYCENFRKFQCPTCGTTFGIPKPITPQQQANTGIGTGSSPTNPFQALLQSAQQATQNAGAWTGNSVIRNALGTLSDSDVRDILDEMGVDTSNFTLPDEYLDELIAHLS